MKLNKCNFINKDDQFFKKYNKICNKVRNKIRNGHASKLMHNEKYPKTKRRSYESRISTDFHGNEMPKEGLSFFFTVY